MQYRRPLVFLFSSAIMRSILKQEYSRTMYLTELLIINSGAIERLTLRPQFNLDGSPKPIILVGVNGAGKTGLLSIIADGLIEIAAQHYQNITPSQGASRKFFRVLGGRTMRVGFPFEISALKFRNGSEEFAVLASSGDLSDPLATKQMEDFSPIANWGGGKQKTVVGPQDKIADIYNRGAYVFFPSARYEIPYWANVGVLDRESDGDFSQGFDRQLGKPLVVQTALQAMKPWIMNLMLDLIVSWPDVFSISDINVLRQMASQNLNYYNTYQSLTKILQVILCRPDALIRWLGRSMGDRRIAILYGDQIGMPSLDSLSAGQATLMAIFGTVLRYGDIGVAAQSMNQIEGIVIVDEIDAHLHADLQHDALPELMRCFPRVQFIVTSHSPLFPLGMRKSFGEDGFTLVELPSGLTIDPERFSEFEASFAYFHATQAFEENVRSRIVKSQRPLVLCEGETDPEYLIAAAELLGMGDVVTQIEFSWVGQKTNSGSRGSGKDNLESAFKFLRSNPGILPRRVVFLYDCDVNKKPEDIGDIFVRSLPHNAGNGLRSGGIENLLPETAIQDRFFRERPIVSGLDLGVVRELQKKALCSHICLEKRDAADFAAFRGPLEELRQLLLGTP